MTFRTVESEQTTKNEMGSPEAHYAARAKLRGETWAQWRRRDRNLSMWRMLTFLAGAAVAIASMRDEPIFGWQFTYFDLLFPAIAFLFLMRTHERVIQARARAERGLAFYENAKQHLSGDWRTHENRGEGLFAPDHPYAADLDLYGKSSLFQRLAYVQTEAGNRALANILSRPPTRELAIERQASVRELATRLDLREDLYVAAAEADRVSTQQAMAWAQKTRRAPSRNHHFAAALLSCASTIAWVGAYAELVSWLVGCLCIGLQATYAFWMRQRLADAVHEAEKARPAIRAMLSMVERIERETFEASLLQNEKVRLFQNGRAASSEIRELLRWMEWEESRRNLFFAPIAGVLLWGTQFSLAIERWRERVGPAFVGWCEALGELEAYLSIAGYAFERSEDVFPDFVEGSPCLRATQIAHPLIDARHSIRNDIELNLDTPLWVISGSNMSGKSTWLRTVGINSVLAWSGAPVCAHSMALTAFRMGATLRVQDSLADGESRFYAEIARIQKVMSLAESDGPLLFLLDEILAGTNSHDRALGAAAILRELVGFQAIGMVTTHDLALTQLADDWGKRAQNWHFEDRLEAGRLVFDYRLKSGKVERSNAIELMQAVGLKVSRSEKMSPQSPLVHPSA